MKAELRTPVSALGFSFFGIAASAQGLLLLWLLLPARACAAEFGSTNDALPPLRPPRSEIPPTFWDQHSTWVVILVILALFLVAAAVWILTRPRPVSPISPRVVACRQLTPLHLQAEDGALLSQVSQILRHYVCAAFAWPPGELNTTDFRRALAADAKVGPELSAALGEFLLHCDLRKFAPATTLPRLDAVDRSLKLIEQCEARLSRLRAAAAAPAPPIIPQPSSAPTGTPGVSP